MERNALSLVQALCPLLGAAIAGPVGGIIGRYVGGVLPLTVGGTPQFFGELATGLASKTIELGGARLPERLATLQNREINHDLQLAFRRATLEALYDLGGAPAFPAAWRPRRDVPSGVPYPQTEEGRALWAAEDARVRHQVRDLFRQLEMALKEGELLALDPQREGAEVNTYLQHDRPAALSNAFFDDVFADFLQARNTLFVEAPALEEHLRAHLLDRTLVHLGEQLKARPAAWRAFNRLLLEQLRAELRAAGQGQAEIVARLDRLLAGEGASGLSFERWTTDLAALLSAAGRLERRLEDGFDNLAVRLASQEETLLARFERLWVVNTRIGEELEVYGARLDAILRIVEEGRRREEDAPPVALDTPPAPGPAPYQGLRYYDRGDAERFFGREELTARLVGRLRHTPGGRRFLAVVGPSGSGKSSLMRAGLIPALQRGRLAEDERLPPLETASWAVHVLTPTAHPLQALAAVLAQDARHLRAAAELHQELQEQPALLPMAARRLLARRAAAGDGHAPHLLLVVDQFEELFTQCRDEDERRAFVDALMAGAAAGQPVSVLIALRADFYGDCMRLPALREALEGRQVLVGPMSTGELRRAIEMPARQGGWEFERGVVELILRDVGEEPGMLPLLSYALLKTWEHRRGRTMLLESYQQAGGVKGAVERTAEGIYRALPPAQQALARNILLRLTELGEGTPDTRRRAPVSELVARAKAAGGEEAAAAVLQQLTDARLVTTTQEPGSGEATAEVAHEALIQAWPTLRAWLEEDREALRVHRRLTEAAHEWDDLDRDSSALYRGTRLLQAQELAASHGEELNLLERDFLEASEAAARRRVAEEEARRQREIEQARALAAEQAKRAEEQAQAAALLRRRAVFLAGSLAVAFVLLVLAVGSAVDAVNSSREAAAAQEVAEGALAQVEVERDTAEAALSDAESARQQADREREAAEAAQAAEAAAAAEAQAAQQEAEQQAALALARELSSSSENSWSSDAERSLLLALHAHRYNEEAGAPLIPAVERALHTSLSFVHGHVRTAAGHQGGTQVVLNAVAADEAGRRLLTGRADGVAQLWDAETERLLGTWLAHRGAIQSVAFSPDGALVATAGADSVVHLWDVATVPPGEPVQTLAGHAAPVAVAIFGPEGETLYTLSNDGTVRAWEVKSGRATTLVTSGGLTHMAHRPGAAQLAVPVSTGLDSGAVVIWDAASGEQVAAFPTESAAVVRVAYDPQGERLAVATADGNITIRDATSGEPLTGWRAHSQLVTTLAFAPDGLQLATAGGDGAVKLWDAQSGEMRLQLPHPLLMNLQLIFLGDTPRLVGAGSDGMARLWNTQSGELLTMLSALAEPLADIALATDGERLALASMRGLVQLWSTAALHDGVQDGETPLLTLSERTEQAQNEIALSPDGKLVAAAAADGSIAVWSAESGKRLQLLDAGEGEAVAVAFAPNGVLLASGGQDGWLRLWDVESGEAVGAWKAHEEAVLAVVFSPDGSELATGGLDGRARIWAADGGELLLQLDGHRGGVLAVAYSPEGERLATASRDSTAVVWERADGVRVSTLALHAADVTGVAFSADGTRLATSSMDGFVGVWNAATGEWLYRAGFHNGGATAVAFGGRGQLLASVGNDGIVNLHPYDTELLLESAPAFLSRALTEEECRRYLHAETCPPLE